MGSLCGAHVYFNLVSNCSNWLRARFFRSIFADHAVIVDTFQRRSCTNCNREYNWNTIGIQLEFHSMHAPIRMLKMQQSVIACGKPINVLWETFQIQFFFRSLIFIMIPTAFSLYVSPCLSLNAYNSTRFFLLPQFFLPWFFAAFFVWFFLICLPFFPYGMKCVCEQCLHFFNADFLLRTCLPLFELDVFFTLALNFLRHFFIYI